MALVKNALEFAEHGPVRLTAQETADTVRLSVHDQGPGIPPEALATVFEAFAVGDDSTTRTHGGVGLGLSLSAKLAERLGGRLSVESAPGDTTFTLVLPA